MSNEPLPPCKLCGDTMREHFNPEANHNCPLHGTTMGEDAWRTLMSPGIMLRRLSEDEGHPTDHVLAAISMMVTPCYRSDTKAFVGWSEDGSGDNGDTFIIENLPTPDEVEAMEKGNQ